MNNFDQHFFKKYIPEGHELIHIIHIHPIAILARIFIVMGLFVVIPSLIYYNSLMVQDMIPFHFFEIYLIILYIRIMYDIFDWYNDVWIVTSEGIISVEWGLINVNSDTLSHQHIEGMGVEQNSILDRILRKGDLLLHKFGEDSYVLENAINPYKAIDVVESLGIEKDEPKESDVTADRFEQILTTLGSMVEKHYTENEKNMKTVTKDEEEQKKEYIKKMRIQDGTIDLREE